MFIKFSKIPAILKKRGTLIPLLLFLTILGVFFIQKEAAAAVLYSQTVGDTLSQVSNIDTRSSFYLKAI